MNTTSMLSRHIVPNLFDPAQYYQCNVRTGVMHDAFGAKCCTLSGFALKGLYVGLKNEAGPAWRLILRRCGERWGTRLAARLLDEIARFYNEALDQMTMARFTALLEEYFAVSGWGRMRFDFSHIDAGLIVADVQNEVFGDILRDSEERAGVLLEGVLKALFSAVTDKEMECFETQSIGEGASASRFLVSTRARLRPVSAWIDAGVGHQEILNRLMSE